MCKPLHKIDSAPLAAKLLALGLLEEFINNAGCTKRQEGEHGLVKVLFCWRQNIQESIKSWVKPLPDGMMGEGRGPGSDWDEGTLALTECAASIGAGEHP